MSTAIEYMGRTLDLTPLCGWDHAHAALARREALTLVYEPGDATRYMIIVAPMPDGNWIISRCQGGYSPLGDQVGAVVLANDARITTEDVWPLANRNDHTASVLSLALNVLLETYR